MADLVTSMQNRVAAAPAPASSVPASKIEEVPAVSFEDKADTLEISKSGGAQATAPKISRWRLFFNRLTKEQIKQVNESRQLPENAKFESGFGHSYFVANNWFNFTNGTQILPAGYELKRNIFGFTRVLPIGTKGLFIKNDK